MGRFMGSEHLQSVDVSWGHEPVGIPLNRLSAFAKATADEPGTFSPIGGEGGDEGVRFMETLHDILVVHWDREPDSLPPQRFETDKD